MTVDTKQVYEEISSDEGKVLHCYFCSEGHATVGIGHKIIRGEPEHYLPVHGVHDPVPEDEGITEDRCYELFQQDVSIAIDGCEAIYSNWEDLPEEMQHVLVNMCFQLGQGGLSKFKNFKSAIENKDFQRASEEMLDSKWARQTPARAERLAERVMLLTEE